MLVNLFDIQDKKVTPSQACYHIPELKVLMDKFPDDYMNIYRYIAFMYCPDSTNPYVNRPEDEKEQVILSDVKLVTSLDEPIVIAAIDKCLTLWETPTLRARNGAKRMIDKMAKVLEEEELSFGKEGNATDVRGIMKEMPVYVENYIKLENIVKEEQSKVRGGTHIPYHQRPGYTDKENALDQ